MNYIARLTGAIQQLHGCASTHVETVPIEERFQGKVVWAGKVEVFDLSGHEKAKRCFAWSHVDGKADEGERFVAVLELPPVKTARDAVRAAIASQVKAGK